MMNHSSPQRLTQSGIPNQAGNGNSPKPNFLCLAFPDPNATAPELARKQNEPIAFQTPPFSLRPSMLPSLRVLLALLWVHISVSQIQGNGVSETVVSLSQSCVNSPGGCVTQEFVVNTCSAYCDPCLGSCSGSYQLSELSEASFAFSTFPSADCSGAIKSTINIQCGPCHSDINLSFSISCPSPSYPWVLGTLLLLALCCFAAVCLVTSTTAIIRARNKNAGLDHSFVHASLEQSVYQSQSYQSAGH